MVSIPRSSRVILVRMSKVVLVYAHRLKVVVDGVARSVLQLWVLNKARRQTHITQYQEVGILWRGMPRSVKDAGSDTRLLSYRNSATMRYAVVQ